MARDTHSYLNREISSIKKYVHNDDSDEDESFDTNKDKDKKEYSD